MRFLSLVVVTVLVCLNVCLLGYSDELSEADGKVEVSMEVFIRGNNLTVFSIFIIDDFINTYTIQIEHKSINI